mmetsp:Transcript_34442/g.55731  ORF Transcript_34442/g.55731 Transcript_34442/m.55731 type:complete len:237 (-) Transcript_34442:541-1251(-)
MRSLSKLCRTVCGLENAPHHLCPVNTSVSKDNCVGSQTSKKAFRPDMSIVNSFRFGHRVDKVLINKAMSSTVATMSLNSLRGRDPITAKCVRRHSSIPVSRLDKYWHLSKITPTFLMPDDLKRSFSLPTRLSFCMCGPTLSNKEQMYCRGYSDIEQSGNQNLLSVKFTLDRSSWERTDVHSSCLIWRTDDRTEADQSDPLNTIRRKRRLTPPNCCMSITAFRRSCSSTPLSSTPLR